MNLYLIGYRCTGKTTVGMVLADRLGFAFIDTDDEVMRRAGMSVSDMVARRGWPFFREMEKKVIRDISGRKDLVAATGGGAVLADQNVREMKGNGRLFWLKASPATIRNRMTLDRKTGEGRPGLTERGALAEVVTVLSERRSIYQKAAHQTVETDGRTIEAIAAEIGRKWENMRHV